MLVVERPKDVDLEKWAIYSDWLFDRGDDEAAEEARAISLGLKWTGGKLYLTMDLSSGHTTSRACREDLRQIQYPGELMAASDKGYYWDMQVRPTLEDTRQGRVLIPICPVGDKWWETKRPGLVALFWITILRIGKELIDGDGQRRTVEPGTGDAT